MATEYKVYKKTALPATLEANAIYYTEGAVGTELGVTVTDSAGVVERHVTTSTEISAMITSALTDNESITAVADIAARDLLALPKNGLVLVADASADTTVTADSAVYFYTKSTDTFEKIYELEGMDVVITWAGITDGPVSTPAQVDTAVTQSHVHVQTLSDIDNVVNSTKGNHAVLGAVTEDAVSGDLTYNTKQLGHTYFGDTPDW